MLPDDKLPIPWTWTRVVLVSVVWGMTTALIVTLCGGITYALLDDGGWVGGAAALAVMVIWRHRRGRFNLPF